MEAIARPLYAQVRDALVARIADGEWKAGEALPSEFALAAELGVSQGTVRKALNALAGENLVERRQGSGTYIPEQTEARALFHFFRMTAPDGTPVVPAPLGQQATLIPPDPAISGRLGSGRRKIWRIDRLRAVAGRPAILERIHLDPARFPALKADTPLPNALYSYYQTEAGQTVARAEDSLSARAAPAGVAKMLGVPAGAALLFAERLAYNLRGEVIELRHSWFETAGQRYTVSLR